MSYTSQDSYRVPRWAMLTLVLAGCYNLLWGAWVVLWPGGSLELLGLSSSHVSPAFLAIWQCVGMLVGVYGIAYLMAARDPARYWPIVLVGLIGKLLGPLGFLVAGSQGHLPWSFGATLLFNDLLWWLPFAALLVHSAKVNSNTNQGETLSWDEALRRIESHRGRTLAELSRGQAVLVVFLRHAGCTFCREALTDLHSQRGAIESEGARLAIVHLDDRQHGAELVRRYDLDDIHRFSDPPCQLYAAFGLERAGLTRLLGPRVLLRAIPALLKGHGLGRIRGDGFRMPGAFVLREGEIVAAYRHRTAGDRPDYLHLVQQAARQRPAAAVSA